MQVLFSSGRGLFAGGWVGPEWRGGVGPATRVRAYDDVYVVLSNTMFYVEQRNALAALIC